MSVADSIDEHGGVSPKPTEPRRHWNPAQSRTDKGVEFFRDHEALIPRLPDSLRRVAELRSRGRTYLEIEADTGLSINSVGNYLTNARVALRALASGEAATPASVFAIRAQQRAIRSATRGHTETEKEMIRYLAAELGVVRLGQESIEARVRRRLPIARDTDSIPRPQARPDCVSCPTCQAWRDGTVDGDEVVFAGRFDGALECGHDFAQAIAHSRPCVFAGCRSGLYLDVNERTGHLTLHFPDVEPDERRGAVTCSEDIADRGGVTLEEVGAATGCTRERVRQIEESGLRKIKSHTGGELGLPTDRGQD
jgi:hypothetical protein